MGCVVLRVISLLSSVLMDFVPRLELSLLKRSSVTGELGEFGVSRLPLFTTIERLREIRRRTLLRFKSMVSSSETVLVELRGLLPRLLPYGSGLTSFRRVGLFWLLS